MPLSQSSSLSFLDDWAGSSPTNWISILGKAPGKSRLASSSISAGILLSRGWSPGANYSLLSCPNPLKGFWGGALLEGKAWLTSHFEEATGLECFHQACGLSHSHHLGWPDSAWSGRDEDRDSYVTGISFYVSGRGPSYGSPAAASDRPSRLIFLWLYLDVASHLSFT